MLEIWNAFHKLKEEHQTYLLTQLNNYYAAQKTAHLARVELENSQAHRAQKDEELETARRWKPYAYD